MDQAAAKQQIVERIKQSNHILVTVSKNPSVDELSACIGMALFLNKLNKHTTAVFSGKVPSTLEFLQPEKTLQATTDSLRDFIISLDKSKADKLRYKVEDQFVRIYITPYRTSIGEKDLVFSEGDFNVEVVLALGVREKEQLDEAITAHGRILHDATVVSINTGNNEASSVGQINWQDSTASSLCEMLVSISEAFGTGLIDNQMATAFLTGMVAETERFSNTKTSPKVMTMAAQLMAAGANQQLIASKLQAPEPEPPKPELPPAPKPVPPKPPKPKTPPPNTLKVPRGEEKSNKEVKVNPGEVHIDEHGEIVAKQTQQPTAPKLEKPPAPPPPAIFSAPLLPPQPATPPPPTPLKNHALLDPATNPKSAAAFSADTQSESFDSDKTTPMDILSGGLPNTANQPVKGTPLNHSHTVKPPAPTAPVPPIKLSSDTDVFPEPTDTTPTLPTPEHLDNARSAVDSALASAPFDAAFAGPLAALNAQPLDDKVAEKKEPTKKEKPEHKKKEAEHKEEEPAKPAPPPVPPPLKLDSGMIIPTTPTPVGGNNQAKKL